MPEALFIAHRLLGSDRQVAMGGAEIHLNGMIDVARKHGFSIKVIQNWHTTETIIEDDNMTVLGVRGSNIMPGVNFKWRKALTSQTEIIHFNMMVQAVPFANARTTSTCHGLTWDLPLRGVAPQWLPSSPAMFRGQRWLLRKWNWFAARFAVNHCRKVLSVDQSLLRLIQFAMPDKRDKVDVVPNFVDVDRFHPGDNPDRRQELGFDSDDIVVFSPRNISLQRGHHILDAMMKQLGNSHPKVKLLIAGVGIVQGAMKSGNAPNSPQQRLMGSLTAAGLSDRVKFTGSVPHGEMHELYSVADIVIIPTYFSEGTSLSALEAMASAKPLIVSNIGGLNDQILDGYTGAVVRPYGIEFADKIVDFINDPEDAKMQAGRALEIVRGNYTKGHWEARVERFLDLA